MEAEMYVYQRMGVGESASTICTEWGPQEEAGHVLIRGTKWQVNITQSAFEHRWVG